jgi:hypothetical protein
VDLGPEEALDALLDEALAGASDHWLAQQADVSLRQVALWRKKRGLVSDKKPGPELASALQGLAPDYDGEAHTTSADLDFETPSYLLRTALDYTQYARACCALTTVAMFSIQQVASATGTNVRDVETALAIWRRHLSSSGRRCLGCAVLLDHRFTEFCSRRCHDHAVR